MSLSLPNTFFIYIVRVKKKQPYICLSWLKVNRFLQNPNYQASHGKDEVLELLLTQSPKLQRTSFIQGMSLQKKKHNP